MAAVAEAARSVDVAGPVTGWHPRLQALHAYWRRIAPAGALPGRQHFDPTQAVAVLPNLFLLDVVRNPLRLRYRLVGTRLVEVAGRDWTGRWLHEVHPDPAAYMTAAMLAVVDDAVPHHRRGKPTLLPPHKQYIEIERLLLPLARDGVAVDMVLACTLFYRPDGTAT